VTERQKLLKKLDSILDEFERARTWGTIEIEIREGVPNFVRKMTTEKLTGAQENTRAQNNARY
jgi:hypothetical protein